MKLRGQAVLLVLLIGYVALGHSLLERQVERQETHKILKKQSPCPRDEYYVEQHCCKLCNEGTYAKADCDVNHGNPECKGCTEGVSYMDKKNGYHECLNCLICDDVLGQNLTEACTVFKNTVCKCKENYFCADTETSPSDGCTKCQECTKCDNGYDVTCQPAKDAVCRATTKRHHYLVPGAFGLLVVISCIVCVFSRVRKATTCPHLTTDVTIVSPGPSFPEELNDVELEELLFPFSRKMELQTVINVVRTMGLPNTNIDSVMKDNANSTDEQKYHLLKEWYEGQGTHGAFPLLINALRKERKMRLADELIQNVLNNQQPKQG